MLPGASVQSATSRAFEVTVCATAHRVRFEGTAPQKPSRRFSRVIDQMHVATALCRNRSGSHAAPHSMTIRVMQREWNHIS
eukprot:387018-Prymnesium_polylepis.1